MKNINLNFFFINNNSCSRGRKTRFLSRAKNFGGGGDGHVGWESRFGRAAVCRREPPPRRAGDRALPFHLHSGTEGSRRRVHPPFFTFLYAALEGAVTTKCRPRPGRLPRLALVAEGCKCCAWSLCYEFQMFLLPRRPLTNVSLNKLTFSLAVHARWFSSDFPFPPRGKSFLTNSRLLFFNFGDDKLPAFFTSLRARDPSTHVTLSGAWLVSLSPFRWDFLWGY